MSKLSFIKYIPKSTQEWPLAGSPCKASLVSALVFVFKTSDCYKPAYDCLMVSYWWSDTPQTLTQTFSVISMDRVLCDLEPNWFLFPTLLHSSIKQQSKDYDINGWHFSFEEVILFKGKGNGSSAEACSLPHKRLWWGVCPVALAQQMADHS